MEKLYLYHGMIVTGGQFLQGAVQAKTRRSAITALKERGIVPLWCRRHRKKVSLRTKIVFYESLLSLVIVGLRIHEALRLLSQTLKGSDGFGMVIILAEKVEQGLHFSTACADFSGAFDHLEIHLLKIAEKTGDMAAVLVDLLARERKREATHRQLYGALIYPVLLLVMFVAVFGVFRVFVVPELEAYAQALSLESQESVVSLVGSRGPLGLIAGCVLGVGLLLWNRRFRLAAHRGLLTLKLGRKILLMPSIGKWFSALSLLLRHRIYLIEAVQFANTVIGAGVIQSQLSAVPLSLGEGLSLSGALFKHLPELPLLIQGQIQIGEASGRLETMVASIAQSLQEGEENMRQLLLKMVQPFATLMMGALLLWIVLTFVSPIYSLIQVV